eukprot:CAMPEP_0183713344 /NCGR_PEP_ID=MMETSP0737-20130205/8214_1 /TAXON_ID=385413 /ORGANISM="Thalassiosira miniscula, Strain CCMP1093" /LENGTH=81 /DNA_ID=CAMNT_0025942111 /DNA_START=123 /DNA_END=365 /DNA_ORIENTATION=+
MRISAGAVAVCLAVTVDGTAARYHHHESSFTFAQRSPWGVVSNGGDASSPSSFVPDDANATDESADENASNSNSNSNSNSD